MKLGWLRAKRARETGPNLAGKSYGTYPGVRVDDTPDVIRWLNGGRAGTIPDGEMIAKEQYAAPAIRHEEKTEEELREAPESWTTRIDVGSSQSEGTPVEGWKLKLTSAACGVIRRA